MMDKKALLNYLKSLDLMALSTMGENPAVCTIYYGVDEDFNFYIVTPPDTEHGKNIALNHKVACSITNTSQKLFETKHKVGVQLQGLAEEVQKDTLKDALLIWTKGNEEKAENFFENISKGIWKSRVYIIRPKIIKWFNEELYGEEGSQTLTFDD